MLGFHREYIIYFAKHQEIMRRGITLQLEQSLFC